MKKKDYEDIIKRLENIKRYIFKNTIAKVDYMKIKRETGQQMPFYAQIVELNDIIEMLKYEKEKAQ